MTMFSRILFVAVLATALPSALLAQEGGIGAEHRYQFVLTAAPSALAEKLMMESLANLDPEMRIDVDRGDRTVKVLAYRPLNPQEMTHMAAAHGVIMVPRQRRIDAAEQTRTNP